MVIHLFNELCSAFEKEGEGFIHTFRPYLSLLWRFCSCLSFQPASALQRLLQGSGSLHQSGSMKCQVFIRNALGSG